LNTSFPFPIILDFVLPHYYMESPFKYMKREIKLVAGPEFQYLMILCVIYHSRSAKQVSSTKFLSENSLYFSSLRCSSTSTTWHDIRFPNGVSMIHPLPLLIVDGALVVWLQNSALEQGVNNLYRLWQNRMEHEIEFIVSRRWYPS
jgi:hypothetical protein